MRGKQRRVVMQTAIDVVLNFLTCTYVAAVHVIQL
jgi:hypothetical protein